MKLINLYSQYLSIQPEIDKAINQVQNQAHFSEGPLVSAFESQFTQSHQTRYCIALNSGTSALHSILSVLDITKDHQVILPTNTCFPTAEAVCLSGATPVFVDCEDQYYNIDPEKTESVITENTRAIIAVHLYGQPVQMDKIKNIADKHGLHLIEDCAQAHLASYDNTLVGNFGIAGAFSFYPTKNLGAYGEGGAVVTNDQQIADKIRALKNHGATVKDVHEFIGHNYRMDSLQAAILSVKLKYLNQWTDKRIKNAELYHKYLSDVDGLILPKQHPNAKHVYHQYVIRTSIRDQLQKHLEQCDIETAIHYPIPCHLQPALSHLHYPKGSFPVSKRLAQEILSLPIAEHLEEEEIKRTSDCIKQFFQ